MENDAYHDLCTRVEPSRQLFKWVRLSPADKRGREGREIRRGSCAPHVLEYQHIISEAWRTALVRLGNYQDAVLWFPAVTSSNVFFNGFRPCLFTVSVVAGNTFMFSVLYV